MDALIALNRRELDLQSELDKIRTEKAALLATLAKPAAPILLTPTKVKVAAAAAAPPPAPKKAAAAAAAASKVSEPESPSVARKIIIRRGSGSTTSSAQHLLRAPSRSTGRPSRRRSRSRSPRQHLLGARRA